MEVHSHFGRNFCFPIHFNPTSSQCSLDLRDGEGLRTSFFTSDFRVVPHCLHKALHFALLHIAFSFAGSLDCLSLSICQVSPYVLPIMEGYDSLLLVHFLTYQF